MLYTQPQQKDPMQSVMSIMNMAQMLNGMGGADTGAGQGMQNAGQQGIIGSGLDKNKFNQLMQNMGGYRS